MIEFKVRECRSWLTGYGKVLAAQLSERLVKRCEGQVGVVLTLTYQREDVKRDPIYADSRELYRRQRERQDLTNFIERLQRRLGVSLAGKWFAKMEFQEGGWVHWHMIILGVERIEHAVLEDAWGWGFVWIERLSGKSVRYVCKYISKDGGVLPAWIFLEPVRTVKVIRCSPGFWGEPVRPRKEEKDGPIDPFECSYPGTGCEGPSVGHYIAGQRTVITVRDGVGRYCRVKGDLFELFWRLRELGLEADITSTGWVRFSHMDMDDLMELLSSAGGAGCPADWHGAERSDSPLGDRPAASSGLHLIKGGNPPYSLSEAISVGGWMWRAFFEMLREEGAFA